MERAVDAPVLVVGGGPVGLSLALGLAHYGVRSILLEKETEPSKQSRALCVWARTLEILRDWGAADALCATGNYWPTLSVCDARSGLPILTVDFSTVNDILDNPGGLILPQYETERVLRERLVASGLCELRSNCEVTSIAQDEHGVSAGARQNGTPVQVRAQYAVGCDGAQGIVRKALGLGVEGTTYGVRAVLSDEFVADDDPSGPPVRVALDRPGLLIAIRFAPGTWRIIASVALDVDDAAATSDAAALERAERVFGRTCSPQTLWRSIFELDRRRAERLVVGRVALAGDAAHSVSPAGGEGMNAGIQDAANLAWKLAYALQGRGDGAVLLQSYEDERVQIVADTVDQLADRLTKFTMQTSPLVRRVGVGVFKRMLRERGMQRKACRGLGMLSGRYTKSALIDGRHPLAGRRIDDLILPNGSRINRVRAGGPALVAVGPVELNGMATIRVPIPPKRWVVKPPVVLIVRPDGIVASVVEKPTRANVESAWRTAFAGEALA